MKTSETQTDKTKCAARIGEHYKGRIQDIRDMQTRMRSSDESEREQAFEEFSEYGLGFDYVPAGTFNGQRRSYWRWQLSWGGPSDEFRFYGETQGECRAVLDRVEYWFMDWYDGAKRNVRGKALESLTDIFNDFAETGTLYATQEKANE